MRKYDNFEFDKPLIDSEIPPDLKVIIVIPAYNERYLKNTLNSLLECTFDIGSVEVIIVINESENIAEAISNFHQKQHKELLNWANNHSSNQLSFYPVYINNIKSKYAGPGMARKIGMDEAYIRFAKINNLNGIICNLDADTIVPENYLDSLIQESLAKNKIKAYSIHYEHLLTDDLSQANKHAIISYEFHLRYYTNMQRLLKLPFAFQTVGSAMAVKAFAYAEGFGMNKRQAGEDFYFLQKFINTGYFKDLNTTTVFPSARISERVPFGTGKTLYNLLKSDISLKTYNFKSFHSLSTMTKNLEKLYANYNSTITKLDKPILNFLITKDFENRFTEIKSHTKDFEGFKKRFYRWFDAFILMKYLHFARDNFFPNIPVESAAKYISNELKFDYIDLENTLLKLREIDKSSIFSPPFA